MEQTNTDNNEYRTGYVYSIRSFNTDKIYIGSTFQKLSKRFCEHRNRYKRWCEGKLKKCSRSIIICEAGDPYIELIKEVKVKNRNELNKYEGEEMRKNKDIIVNRCMAGRNMKEYYNDHKEVYKENNKNYQKEHKDEIQKYKKEYRKEHKKALLEYHKEYCKEHKEVIKKYKKEYHISKGKISCLECNKQISKGNLKKHLKTKKHIENSKTEI